MAIDRFPVQTTIAVDFPTDPGEVYNEVAGESAGISSTVESLRSQADSLYASAASLIQAVYNFTPTPIPDVEFEVIPDGYSPLVLGAYPPFPQGLYSLDDAEAADLGDLPEIVIEPFQRSTFDAPTADPVTFPDTVSLPSIGAAPDAPVPIQINITPAPELVLELQALPDPGQAPQFSGSIDVGDLIFADIEPFPACDIEFPDDSAFDTYRALANNTFARSDYAYKTLPAAIQAAQALVSGNFVIDIDALEAGTRSNAATAADKYDRRVSTIWSRRGFEQNEAKREHIDRVRARVDAEMTVDYDAAVERWRMRLMPVALQLCTAAHESMVTILGELYDLDFAFLEAEQAGLRGLYALAAAEFNFRLAQIEAQVSEYRGLTAQVRANADRYRALAGRAESVGRLNRSLAQGYAAGQSARESRADTFIANVQANEARLEAYEANIRAKEAEAQALRARVIEYEGQVAEWEGNFNAARTQYREVRARNQAVIARNRAATTRMSAKSAESAAVADAAAVSATEALASAAFLRGEIAKREGAYEKTNYENTVETLQYSSDVADYRANAAGYSALVANDIQLYDNIGRRNSAVSSNYSEISRNAIRAAELTQSNRIQLSNIFDGLYDAAGRADAARIAGQLSKFRASYGLSASGDLSYDSDISKSVSYSDDITNDQSNSRRTIFNEAEE